MAATPTMSLLCACPKAKSTNSRGFSAATASISITICSIIRWSRLGSSRTVTRFRKLQIHHTAFNTVRRMTDVRPDVIPHFEAHVSGQDIRTTPTKDRAIAPNITEPRSQYLQNWRNSTDTWTGAVDWKPIPKTMLTFEETVMHYKGDTNWGLTGLGLQLANGMPVTLGFDNQKPPSCGDGNPPIVTSSTTPPTANPTCSGYLQYSRFAPTRTLMPTEEFRFQSSSIKNIQMNGDVRYTGGTMNLPDYNELFVGLDNMGKRVFNTTGYRERKENRRVGGLRHHLADFGEIQSGRPVRFLGFPRTGSQQSIRSRFPRYFHAAAPRSRSTASHNLRSNFHGHEDRNQHPDCHLGAYLEGQHLARLSLSATRYNVGSCPCLRMRCRMEPPIRSRSMRMRQYSASLYNPPTNGGSTRKSKLRMTTKPIPRSARDSSITTISSRATNQGSGPRSPEPSTISNEETTFRMVNHLDHIRSFALGATLMPKSALWIGP